MPLFTKGFSVVFQPCQLSSHPMHAPGSGRILQGMAGKACFTSQPKFLKVQRGQEGRWVLQRWRRL